MAFQTPVTIKKALEHMARNDYVLPAIQREVVWKTDQIVRLFDSLMQGYPIGSFLFWKVDRDHSKEYVFYEFMTDYHQLNSSHLERYKPFEPGAITGVLDGQQRLTALNIGLRGSHAEKLPRLWVDSPWAYPVRHLYLGLDGPAQSNDLGMVYDFRFLTKDQLEEREKGGQHWFRVARILTFESTIAIFNYLHPLGLTNEASPFAFPALNRLFEVVHMDKVINYFEEESQDLDKVLNIFIRVNSGGTVLSYSDLLLSIATAQWTQVDAREAIHQLVDELNDTGGKFNLNKDLVLKSGLVLSDVPSIGFRVTNFNTANMALLEQNWLKIADALRLAVRLLSDFGFSGRNVTADSVIIPVAYYLYRREAGQSYLTSNSLDRREDRDRIRGWVVRSLLKAGIWGSGLDQLLMALRSAIAEHGAERFPVEELEATMAQRGKSLQFGSEEIEDLVEIAFGDKRVFALLSLIYPGMDFRNEFHIDHIFPRSRFTATRLRAVGVPESDIDWFIDSVNRLPNLQLLEGPINVSKQARLPASWMEDQYPDAGAREAYRARHELGEIPSDIVDFKKFYSARRKRMKVRLQNIVVH